MKINENEYVDKTLQGKTDLLAEMEVLANLDEKESADDYRSPLSIDCKTTVRIMLSWGGPGDGFKLDFNEAESDPCGGVYYRADWGVYKEVALSDEEVNQVFDFYLYGERPTK